MSRAPQKDFDAVATMREIRERVSRQITSMSAEEQREWLRSRVASDSRLSRLMDKAQKPSRPF